MNLWERHAGRHADVAFEAEKRRLQLVGVSGLNLQMWRRESWMAASGDLHRSEKVKKIQEKTYSGMPKSELVRIWDRSLLFCLKQLILNQTSKIRTYLFLFFCLYRSFFK